MREKSRGDDGGEGGREVIVPGEVAWQGRFIKKRGGRRRRQGKPGPSRSLSITLQSFRNPWDETRGSDARGRERKKKINLDTSSILASRSSNGGQFFPG